MTVYVKVPVSERLPEKEWTYITDKGVLDFKKSYGGIFIRNVRIVTDVSFWLEERDLPTDDEVSQEANRLRDKGHSGATFMAAINYILNKLK